MAAETGRAPADRRWATLVALVLLWMQLAWAALNDLRSIGVRVGLVLAAWLAWRRFAGRPRDRRSGPLDALAIGAAAILAASLFALYRLDVRPSILALLAAAVVAVAAWLAPLARWRTRRARGLAPGAVGLAAIAAAIALAGPVIGARWGADDDHEIVTFVGADGRLGLGEIPRLLAGTEVGQPGHAVRFRPTYYTLRLVESALWGDSAALWYAARIAMFAVTLGLVGLVLARAIGLLAAGLFVLYALTQRFWADVWCRLGPGETYAALGSALYLTGFDGVWRDRASGGKARDWLLLLAGSLLAVGSKENFLLLALPTVVLLAACWARRRPGPIALAAAVTSLAYALFVGASVALAVSRAGGDVYGASVTPGYRIGLLREGAARFLTGFSPGDILAGLGIVGLALYGLATPETRRRAGGVMMRGAAAVLALACFYATQYAFYLGRQQTGMRYDFPGALAAPVALLAAAAALLALLKALGFDRALLRGVRAGLTAGLVLAIAFRDPLLLRQGCLANAERTATFTARLDEVAAQLRQHPERPLVVAASGVPSYERVRGLPAFLARLGVRNPLFLSWDAPLADDQPFERKLVEDLSALSRAGGDGYAPLPDPVPADCFGLGIGRDPGPPCATLGTLPR